MKSVLKKIIIFVLGWGMTLSAWSLDDEFYYELGGGEPISRAATNRNATFSIGADAAWNTDLVCGDFDMSFSVDQQLQGVKGAFSNLMTSVIGAATGVVASLPGLVIQKLNPALYDLLQNGILQGSKEFHLAEATCEGLVDTIGDVSNGGGWETLAKGHWWATESQGGGEILETKERADSDGLDAGVIWVAGNNHGGRTQPPIELVGDTSKAGYNQLIQRSPSNTTQPLTTCAGAAICEEWASPQDFANWMIEVVGEEKVRTCKNCNKVETQAGKGLAAQVTKEQNQIAIDLDSLVAAGGPPSLADLKNVSGGPGMLISRRVVEAIREEKPEEQAALISRLAAEMALSRTMERAMIARRALLAGMKEPNIASTGIATDSLKDFVSELEQEIDHLLFEMDVRHRVAANTASHLLMRDKARKHVPIGEDVPSTRFSDGATHN